MLLAKTTVKKIKTIKKLDHKQTAFYHQVKTSHCGISKNIQDPILKSASYQLDLIEVHK